MPRRYPLYIFDLDGTLFRGNEPIPGAAETVAQLRREGAKIRYLTNNSSTTRADYQAKLDRLGFAAAEQEIYSSATGSASRLQELGTTTVFVVGEPGLITTLQQAGIQVLNVDDEGKAGPSQSAVEPEALLVGICRTFTYALLSAAMQVGLRGAKFFATNTDATYPMEGGKQIPGAGSIVSAVATCLGREPEVFGKPHPYLVKLILREAGVTPSDALVVGDRYETDIVAGKNAGCDTLLVLTGVTQEPLPGQTWATNLSVLTRERGL